MAKKATESENEAATTPNVVVEEKRKIVKKEFSLSDYKNKKGLNDEVKDKPLDFIPMSKAYVEATGMAVPIGFVSIVAGYSSVGKSTMVMEAIVGSQKKGILPVIIDLENNFSFERAKLMGMEFDEVFDETTGELISYDGFFIYVNNDYILKNFDKKRNPKLNEATIEGLAMMINTFLDEQEKGDLDVPLFFALDSVGVLDSEKSILGVRNNMFNAGSYEANFKSILNYRIPASRKETRKHTNTLLAVNKIWLDSMSGGAGTIKMKGGECFFYSSRIITLLGNTLTHGTKKLYAQCTVNGEKKSYQFGVQVKIKMIKDHINGNSFESEIVSTAKGFISVDEIENYKRDNKKYILSKLEISDTDIQLETVKEEDKTIIREEDYSE